MKRFFFSSLLLVAGMSGTFVQAMESIPGLPESQGVQADGIYSYESAHEEQIRQIALDNMANLTTFSSDREGAYRREIVGAIAGKDIINSVYLHCGKPVGFINYRIYYPWYRIFAPTKTSPKAEIQHLAVDQARRSKGFGSALFNHALTDCQNKSVSRVDLSTTEIDAYLTETKDSLNYFYTKFGFNGRPHCSGLVGRGNVTKYTLRFKPSPMQRFSRAALGIARRLIMRR